MMPQSSPLTSRSIAIRSDGAGSGRRLLPVLLTALLPFTGQSGVIDDTLDGTDPRAPGGAVSPTAIAYGADAPTNLPSKKVITASSLASEVVGGPDEGVYHSLFIPTRMLIDGPNLLAAELHQRGPNSGETT